MNRSIIVTAVVLAMNGTLGATARADQQAVPQQAQHSTVLGHRVLSITPRVVEEINGKRTRHLTGADIRIEAEPGMTAEYLTVALRHMREGAGQATTESVFGVEGSAVEVRIDRRRVRVPRHGPGPEAGGGNRAPRPVARLMAARGTIIHSSPRVARGEGSTRPTAPRSCGRPRGHEACASACEAGLGRQSDAAPAANPRADGAPSRGVAPCSVINGQRSSYRMSESLRALAGVIRAGVRVA